MELRVTGRGHLAYLQSATIVSTFVQAIALLLEEHVETKPVLQALDDNAGIYAYMFTLNVTISMRTKIDVSQFEIIIHTRNDFSSAAITSLASGYFAATEMKSDTDDIELPTRRMHVKVDSSDQWRLITSELQGDEEIIVFKPE